jgi:hypothetical protein
VTGVSAPENVRSYDLCLRTSSSGLLSLERGITLADDRLEWTVGERADATRLGAIVEVRLQTGGVPTRPSSLCRIQLNDGYALTLNNNRVDGEDRNTDYRAFVTDLHRRLSALGDAKPRFVAGYEETKYWIMLACTFLLGVIAVLIPIVLLIILQDLSTLSLLIVGGIFIWPFVLMLLANTPRSYDPHHVPQDLVPPRP